MYNCIICRYHEIATKGNNRNMFERCLADNIRHLLSELADVKVYRVRGRVRVERTDKGEFTSEQLEVIKTQLRKCFGLESFSPAVITEVDMEKIRPLAVELAASAIAEKEGENKPSFRVRARRSNKRFPLTSKEIEIDLVTAGDLVFEGQQMVTETVTDIESTPRGTVVIPQATTTVTVNYTQKALAGTPELTGQSITISLALDAELTPWEPGKHYVYTLIFGLDEILINPSVADWEDVNAGEDDITALEVTNETDLRTALSNGKSVRLAADVTVSETLVINGDATLDLNGKTITNKVENTLTDVIQVPAGAILTINGNGNITAVSGNDGYAVIAEGKLIINGGTFQSGVDTASEPNAVIYARGNGEVYVNGGLFLNDNNTKFVLNKKDADRATTKIEVKGGKFYNFNPADNAAEGAGTNFLATGYKVEETVDGTDNVYTVVAE